MKKKILSILMCLLLITGMLAGCGGSDSESGDGGSETDSTGDTSDETLAAAAVSDMEALTVEYKNSDEYDDWTKENYTTIAMNGSSVDIDGSGATANNSQISITEEGYYVLSGELSDGTITIDVPGENDKVYLIFNGASITCSDGAAIIENTADKVIISLVDGTENSVTGGTQTDSVVADDDGTDTEDTNASDNDGTDTDDEGPTAAIYCEDSLTINGTGTLNVTGNFNDGITSRATMKIMEGVVNVTAADDGIVGRNRVIIKDGTVNITASGDGIKATKSGNTEKGIIYIEGGGVEINAGADGMQAENIIKITGGTFNIVTGGSSDVDSSGVDSMADNSESGVTADREEVLPSGAAEEPAAMESGEAQTGDMPNYDNGGDMPDDDMSNGGMKGGSMPDDDMSNGGMKGGDMPDGDMQNGDMKGGWGHWENENTQDDSTQSAKAIKSTAGIYISGGTFNIDSSDDAVHTNGNAYICGGTFEISSGDDGMHSDSDMQIVGGTINITKSYEGIEGANIIISGGEISLVASDDGLNAAGGNDSSSIDGRKGMNNFSEAGDYTIDISGGSIEVSASGDGVDSNGSIYMSGGTLIVNGPEDGQNSILDYGSEFAISGGTLLCSGTSGMFQTVSSSSTQNCINYSGSSYEAGAQIELYDGDSLIASYTAEKNFNAVIISTPELVAGNEYTLVIDSDSQTVEATSGADYN